MKDKEEIDKLIIEACKSSLTMSLAHKMTGLPYNTFRYRAISLGVWNPNQGGKGTAKKPNGKEIPLDEILEGKHPSYQYGHLKRRLLHYGYKTNKCEECGISEWNNKKLVCQLDHIDGNRHNHRLDNLRMLCPNCHSQTHTYCGKNKN